MHDIGFIDLVEFCMKVLGALALLAVCVGAIIAGILLFVATV
jgi:hypothetical protein